MRLFGSCGSCRTLALHGASDVISLNYSLYWESFDAVMKTAQLLSLLTLLRSCKVALPTTWRFSINNVFYKSGNILTEVFRRGDAWEHLQWRNYEPPWSICNLINNQHNFLYFLTKKSEYYSHITCSRQDLREGTNGMISHDHGLPWEKWRA